MENADWYQGTADAVRRQMHRVLSHKATECLILSGDHLYRMDYRPFVEQHRQRRSDVTIAVKPVPRYAAPELGILKVDGDGRVVDFVEKPQSDAVLDELKLQEGGREGEEMFLASPSRPPSGSLSSSRTASDCGFSTKSTTRPSPPTFRIPSSGAV